MATMRPPYSTESYMTGDQYDPSMFEGAPGGQVQPYEEPGRQKVQPVPTVTPATPPPSAHTSMDQLSQFYNQYLHRTPGYYGNGSVDAGDTYKGWLDVDPTTAEQGIANSAEALGYRNQAPSAPAPAAPSNDPFGLAGSLPQHEDLTSKLKGLFDSGGGFNKDIVARRTESARENLGRQRKSQLANDQAALASRGLMGSGPEVTALGKLNENVDNQYANAVSDIYADESRNADQRMMQALGLDTNLSEADARNILDSFSNSTARSLGLGNLALQNSRNANDYNLGMADYGLRRDTELANLDNAQIDQLIKLIEQLHLGANTSTQGYV